MSTAERELILLRYLESVGGPSSTAARRAARPDTRGRAACRSASARLQLADEGLGNREIALRLHARCRGRAIAIGLRRRPIG